MGSSQDKKDSTFWSTSLTFSFYVFVIFINLAGIFLRVNWVTFFFSSVVEKEVLSRSSLLCIL